MSGAARTHVAGTDNMVIMVSRIALLIVRLYEIMSLCHPPILSFLWKMIDRIRMDKNERSYTFLEQKYIESGKWKVE